MVQMILMKLYTFFSSAKKFRVRFLDLQFIRFNNQILQLY